MLMQTTDLLIMHCSEALTELSSLITHLSYLYNNNNNNLFQTIGHMDKKK